MTNNIVRTVCLAALLGVSLTAQAALDLKAKIVPGPQVKVGKLANGLTYYIQKNKKPEQKVELRLVVKAGSILEDDDQQGLAHFVEHMAFNGSTHFKKHELISYLQSIGVKFGADLNAYTSFDQTVYVLPLPTSRKENIDKAFTVLEDWAQGVTFNDADIDKERDIVLEELRLGKGAADRMGKVLLPKIFNGSKYAQRLPIGQEDIIRNFKPDTLRRFYRDWYRPNLMAVVVVGDIDPIEAEKLVKSHFSKLKNPPNERARQYAAIPLRTETEAVVVTDKEATTNTLLIRYPVQAVRDLSTVGAYREQLVQSLFAGMLGQRLQELSQLPNPPFIGGSSMLSRLTPRYRSYNSNALLGTGGAVPAIEALVQENERARRFGFTATELERTKKNVVRAIEIAYNERDKTDSGAYAAEYMRNFLEGEAIPGVEAEYRFVKELVPGITLEEMNAYARRTIPADSGKLVVYTGVERKDMPPPSGDELLAAITAAGKTQVTAHDDKALAAALMDKPPSPGSIVAESQDKALGLTTLTLSNGVKVILKPTDFRNDQVLMSAARFGGQTLFDDKDIINARYANSIVGSMGLKDYSPLDVSKILAGKAAMVNMGLANYTDVVTGSAGASDVETMLQLVWLKFAGVRRDDDLFKSYIGKQVELARNRLAQPGARFGDTIIATLYNNNPRAPRPLRPEEFSQISLERSIEIYRERFSSASGLTFVLVGSFDPAAIKPLVATYLGSLPTPEIPVTYRDVGMRPVTGVVKREVRSGADDKSTISLTFTGDAEVSEAEELRLAALIEVMNLRIIDVLREKLALIYGGGMSGGMGRIPYGHYSISATLPTGPANVDKVLETTFVEIGRIKRNGPEPQELEKVKRNWLENHRKALRENGYWLGQIQSALTEGKDLASILNFNKQVEALTAEDVQAAAQRYFNTDNYVQVVLYPEKTGTQEKANGAQ
ncbi:M16 family metallopeptidase [Massilia horti]|uniref:Insulinase family protein n=1 Tax=Massilia horti TaxID=2562153 RepID=A0A4Y9T209_9BURK|nr:M16 family metallopeptidase [Massilia horti]TFW31635.1 insulinase family protein [Massilia horti]